MPADLSTPREHAGLRPRRTGLLVVNLGTPEAPTTPAVRRYLAEFLSDPRVVELPRWLWLPILHGFVLRVRPARSAAAYRKIWTPAGSPLLVNSRALTDALAERLGHGYLVRLAMSYGEPSLDAALEALAAEVERLVVLPLYPQFSASTTGSVFAAVTGKLAERRFVPELRFISHYHEHPRYIASIADSVRAFRAANGSGERLLFSFHGLPRRMVDEGDPYRGQCLATADRVAAALGLDENEWRVSFQSRVGRAEWLRPYTDETVSRWGKKGLGEIDVVCPGFAADCLETLEEIAMQNAELYRASGGGTLRYVPALNARPDHVALLAALVAPGEHGKTEPAAGTGGRNR